MQCVCVCVSECECICAAFDSLQSSGVCVDILAQSDAMTSLLYKPACGCASGEGSSWDVRVGDGGGGHPALKPEPPLNCIM